jgi:pimeloyl-ACP methyl ester carboxylesterase
MELSVTPRRLLSLTLILASFLIASASRAALPEPPAGSSDETLVSGLAGFENGVAAVNGIKLHYVIGGHGPLLVLLPGWPQNWWEYHKVMPDLAKNYRVVSVDLRGMGTSDKPEAGYDKKTMAKDIAELIRHLGAKDAHVVGHDIGAQVAFAVAQNHPEVTRRLVMIDVVHPDEGFSKLALLPEIGQFRDKVGDASHQYLWWFAFHQVKGVPERLMAGGGIRVEQDWFFHYLTVDERSIDARSRDVYARAYWTADAIRAGNAWYQAFPQDIVDARSHGILRMPVLGIAGPGYDYLKLRLTAQATDLQMVKVENAGHFIPEEQPAVLIENLTKFLRP